MASMGIVGADESTLITLSNQDTRKGRQIFVKVQRGEKNSDHIWYCIGRNAMLHHLILDYTQRVGVAFSSVRFLYDGGVIKQFSTPNDLEMEDGDIIDVVNVCHNVEVELVTFPKNENHIVLILQGPQSHPLHFRIGRKTPLRDLMLDYCYRNDLGEVRFLLNGRTINTDQTANDLGLEDEEVIHVLPVQRGC